MGFDPHTLEILQFPKIRDIVASHCFSSLGKELAFKLDHLIALEKVVEEIDLVTEMVKALERGQSPPFSGLSDIRLVVRRASIGAKLTPEQLLQITDVLLCTGNMYRYRMRLGEDLFALSDTLAGVEDFAPVAKTLQGCMDSRGNILDMASPELAAIRVKIHDKEERINHAIRRVLQDPEIRKILRYPNATFSGDHCVLPVAANHRQKVQGVIHRTSATGDTLFIEPTAVANLSSERACLKAEELREIGKILRHLSAEVGKIAKPLSFTLDILSHLDFLTGKAKFSSQLNMAPPLVAQGIPLWLKDARHPVLQHLFQTKQTEEKRQVVPVDIRLGDGYRILVITGPNTGGKTVCLKTAGSLCAMALSGLHIPASPGCTIPFLSGIFADIGDEQSLEQSLSTFSSHLTRITSIFQEANETSLVLLDELGAGTDPSEGSALGRAILDGLGERKSLGMVSTHLGDLKTYALKNPHAENAAVEFDTQTLRPTYRLLIGQFGKSNALRIAARLGFPADLLKKARRHFRFANKGKRIIQLQKERETEEQEREKTRLAQAAQREEQAAISQQELLQELQAAKIEALEKLRLEWKPGDLVLVERFGKEGVLRSVDSKKGLARVDVGLGQWEIPLKELFPPAQEAE
ncbi:MAG: DNA strand exchange inhibitor protein [Gemmataceae bacterium]|nr:DNA strand exchange inhibitor protein [Gemmataceae bacterium]